MDTKIRYAASLRLLGAKLLVMTSNMAQAQDSCRPGGRGAYVGIFGGAGSTSVNNFNQVGTALFPDFLGGPLFVSASGDGDNRAVGMGGVHFGYEGTGWNLSRCENGLSLLPAAELEGFYLGGTQRGTLTAINRLNGHVFDDSFYMDSGVFLTNAILSLRSSNGILAPYVGLGAGAAAVAMNGADSAQTLPAEPGINHFNSNSNSSSWGFAAQAKAGVRLLLTERVSVFTEYRFLYVGSTNYTYGSTQYPTHIATTPWNVYMGDMFTHMGVAGLEYSF